MVVSKTDGIQRTCETSFEKLGIRGPSTKTNLSLAEALKHFYIAALMCLVPSELCCLKPVVLFQASAGWGAEDGFYGH